MDMHLIGKRLPSPTTCVAKIGKITIYMTVKYMTRHFRTIKSTVSLVVVFLFDKLHQTL